MICSKGKARKGRVKDHGLLREWSIDKAKGNTAMASEGRS